MPLDILAPKLALKTAKELVNLHNMYMPSKILLKDAHTLLKNHKCETCKDFLAVFRLGEWAIALHGMYESALFFVLILK